MQVGLQDFLNKRSAPATQVVVNSKNTQLGGNMTQSQLEDLIHIVGSHNARVELVAGVLTVITN